MGYWYLVFVCKMRSDRCDWFKGMNIEWVKKHNMEVYIWGMFQYKDYLSRSRIQYQLMSSDLFCNYLSNTAASVPALQSHVIWTVQHQTRFDTLNFTKQTHTHVHSTIVLSKIFI